MPEETQIDTGFKEVLEHLEDFTITNYRPRIENYEAVKQILEQNQHIPVHMLQRILNVCVHDMKEDLRYTAVTLGVIQTILRNVKQEKYTQVPDFIPSALAVINIIKTVGLARKVDVLRVLCFDIFLSYPSEVLIAVATNHCSDVFEIFDLYCHQRIPMELKIQTWNIIIKFLKILPPPNKTQFVKDGMSVWFFNIIPVIMVSLSNETQDTLKVLEILELLTEELSCIEYTNNPQWTNVLECICNPAKYPHCMKSLLENGSDYWHRLWIVFIKLLNTQITRNTSGFGTPINSMLPVVELAFKMDVANRCKAFQCWNVLIDKFSMETNENCISKRIKLLVIPLKLNNAKVEPIVLAKFETWWHLIRKFQPRLDKFVETIIIPFLHFCFGKHSASPKPGFVPGQISDRMKCQSVKALVEIAGHVSCDGCTDLPKLDRNLIKVKYLVDYWSDWTYSLKIAIKAAAKDGSDQIKQQVRCLWKSFVMTVGELPANNIRKDLFSELLTILSHLIQDCDNKLADIVFNDMILSLYDEEIKSKKLFETKCEEHPLYNVLSVVWHPSLNSVYNSSNAGQLVKKFRKITDNIVNDSKHMEWLLKNLPTNDNILKFWIAIAESICESKDDICPHSIYNVLMWPLKSMNQFSDSNCSALQWHAMYNLVHSKINKIKPFDIDKEILKYLFVPNESNCSMVYFTLCALLAVLKCKLVSEKSIAQEPELLQNLLSKVEDYQYIEKIFPILVDTLTVMLNNSTTTANVVLAQNTITCVKKVLLLTNPVLKQNQKEASHVLVMIENLLKHIGDFFKIESYSNFNTLVVNELIECASLLKPTTIVNNILSTMKTFLLNSMEGTIKVTSVIDVIEKDDKLSFSDACDVLPNKEFTTPVSKEIPKKVKKKEPSIVNKVVENGEEYIVVKSNWKFNPKKLTENQKEKFQRKREDIPALYQDLSQSQDEFKLVTWKTDSQDILSSNSKSSKSANDDASVILLNLPSSNIVPTIIENIFSENVTKQALEHEKQSQLKELPTPKNTKSPRMALKDRVFRNVRNLIEKTTATKEGENIHLDQIENVPRTPSSKARNTIDLINSAPPIISSERPSRVKRKPKKFDDTELFELKKRRHSQNNSPIDVDMEKSINLTLNKEANDCIESENIANCVINTDNEVKPVPSDTPEITISSVKSAEENIDLMVSAHQDSLNRNKMNGNENETKEEVSSNVNENLLVSEVSTKIEERLHDKKDNVTNDSKKLDNNISTPKFTYKLKEVNEQKPSVKKNSTRKSRIEKELAIDTVEGHPFLKIQSEKRLTRKNLTGSANNVRKNTLTGKLNRSKSDTKNVSKSDKKPKDKSLVNTEIVSIVEGESQEKSSNSSDYQPLFDELPCSEDIIESSQDSSLTTISLKSSKKTHKRLPVISLERIKGIAKLDEAASATHNLPQDMNCEVIDLPNTESKDDTELSQNRTAADEKTEVDITENMDTEPIGENMSLYTDVIIVTADIETSITISSEETLAGKETQELAAADTQPTNLSDVIESEITHPAEVNKTENFIKLQNSVLENESRVKSNINSSTSSDAQEDEPKKMTETIDIITENYADASSPYKDDTLRQQDFLNNTLQISPIKLLSPDRQNKSLSPETSNDYVVIKLASPVHSNGEPFEKCGSPEFFTEDKISPDKRDQSPPREEVTTNNTSPSSSLSLKKNRPQVRSGGRAAHMLGLCVPDKLHTIINSEKAEPEEVKKCSPSSTPARRNLRILYNFVTDNSGDVSENEDNENFLKLKKSLPAVDSSPSGPILKRKLAEIADEVIMSPASKRKRVSFHDPPVSTTISVQKYIEPSGVRSPQSSVQKRQERQLRLHANMKSPKRLDTVFKLDTVLTKAVESFIDVDLSITDDTETSSLEPTPAVEIVKTSELNDSEPICAELLNCIDPISNIATDLSSPAMKELFVRELIGQVETVGDLAKMTEIEVNRLCIKAPKVKVAKKVLMDYASKKTVAQNVIAAEETRLEEPTTEPEKVIRSELEVQTNEVLKNNMEVQTTAEPSILASTQTEILSMLHTSVQTEESGSKSTADVISSCLTERQDFIEQHKEKLDESHIHEIANKLTLDAIIDPLLKKSNTSTTTLVLNRILEQQSTLNLSDTQNKGLLFLRDYLCERFESRDLILFCSQLLQKIHDKPV